MKFNDKIVWITGASSGIGEQLAYRFAREKATIIISSRNTEKLNEVKSKIQTLGEECHVLPIDLSDPGSIKITCTSILEKFQKVDILVNNGGVSQRSLIMDTPVEIDRKIMEINYFGTVQVTKTILPAMIKYGGGHIVVISSIVGKFGFPMRSAYSASKHALQGFFETVQTELDSKNIKVTIVSPGRINTNISINALNSKGEIHGIMDPGQQKGMKADICAKRIVNAVARGKKDILVGGKELIMVHFRNYLPGLFYKLASKVSPT